MARTPTLKISTAAPSATTPISTGIPISVALPGYMVTPTITAEMQVTMTNMQLSAVTTPLIQAPVAVTVPPVVTSRLFAETGIARRESSGTPHWTFPAAVILLTLIGAWLVFHRVATPTVQIESAIEAESEKKAVAETIIVPKAQCTNIKTRDCSTRLNDGTYRQITPKGTEVRYGNCEQGTDDSNRPYMRCERISAYAEYVEGLPVQYRDFRHIGGNTSLSIEGSRLIN